jgi:hypothetical protein
MVPASYACIVQAHRVFMNPESNASPRKAAAVAAAWPYASRSERRAGAHWWWKNCQRPSNFSNFTAFWQYVNANCGVISKGLLSKGVA